jgi:hypothetical protein
MIHDQTSEPKMIVTNYTPEDLKKLPLRAIVALRARCARRIEELAIPLGDDADAARCRCALESAIQIAEDFANGLPCGSAESVVAEAEAARAACKRDFEQEMAMGGIIQTARAAANALRALELCCESARSNKVGSAKLDPISNLADVTADLAARAAFTAAFEAVAAEGHSDPFIQAAIGDYERLLRLDLGKYPSAGDPVDPSRKGPLGPLEK